MNFLRSAFVALCLAPSASGFASTARFPSNVPQSTGVVPANDLPSSRLFVGLHEPSPGSVSDNKIRRETAFIQVLKEVATAKAYLVWLVEESGGNAEGDARDDDGKGAATLAEVAEKAAAGGGGALW